MSNPLQHLALVAVGSANPVKVGAVRAVLGRAAPHATVQGVTVPSGVRDQPWGDEETIRGAVNRASAARAELDADWGIGVEGGVVEAGDGGVRTCAWVAVVSRDGREGVGGSLSLALPPRVAALVRDGMELGHAMDAVTGEHDVKRGVGAVGILTNGLVTRQQAYEVLIAYAITPFLSDAATPAPRPATTTGGPRYA